MLEAGSKQSELGVDATRCGGVLLFWIPFMPALPPCPKCKPESTYDDGGNFVRPAFAREWTGDAVPAAGEALYSGSGISSVNSCSAKRRRVFPSIGSAPISRRARQCNSELSV